MKDITRIHIAKVPYSIELSAKKELENYTKALEAYTADSELLQDIEIRITELLLERGVKQEDVISSDDVVAIREQLGEPKEFMTDEAAEEVDTELLSKSGTRKLYRNIDIAILGGVLAGIANYLSVNVLWVRLVFIVLLFVSVGLFIPLYLLAWFIIPPARSAAEKLQMTGRPVTLSSIRELNETGSSIDTERRMAILKRVFTTLLGVSAVGVALGSAALMAAAGVQLLLGQDLGDIEPYGISLALMFASGALLVALSVLVAIASFAQKFNKRIWVSALIITVLGLLTSGIAVTTGIVQQRTQYETAQRNMVQKTRKLPITFSAVTTLHVDIPSTTAFAYVVDPTATTIKQRLPKNSTQAKVTIENNVASVSLKKAPEHRYNAYSTITIYGPALSSLIVQNGSVSYSANTQAKLSVEAHNSSSVWLNESRIDELTVALDNSAQFSGDNSSILSASFDFGGSSTANLGNIKALKVKSPEACATYTTASLNVQNIFNTTYDYNGTQVASRSITNPCFELSIITQEPIENYQD